MHNRGNGKGGGIAVAGMVPEQMGVDETTLKECTMLQIALLDGSAKGEVEKECIEPFFEVAHTELMTAKADYQEIGLDVKPPDIARY